MCSNGGFRDVSEVSIETRLVLDIKIHNLLSPVAIRDHGVVRTIGHVVYYCV